MRYILWVMALLEACDVTNNGCHLGFYQELEFRIKPQEMVIFCALHGRWHINKRFAGFLSEDLLLLLKEGEKTCIFTQNWLDHLLLFMSYFVTIAADHHQTCLKICARDERTTPENIRCWCFTLWEKTQKNLMGGWHTPPPPPLYIRGLTSQDYHSRVNESGFGILVAPLI